MNDCNCFNSKDLFYDGIDANTLEVEGTYNDLLVTCVACDCEVPQNIIDTVRRILWEV